MGTYENRLFLTMFWWGPARQLSRFIITKTRVDWIDMAVCQNRRGLGLTHPFHTLNLWTFQKETAFVLPKKRCFFFLYTEFSDTFIWAWIEVGYPIPQKLGGRLEIGRLTGIQHVYTCSSKIWMLSAKHNQSSQPLILNTPILWS